MKVAVTNIPNDLFVFGAWHAGKIHAETKLEISFHDLWKLNRLAANDAADIVKISFNALAPIINRYKVLPIGCAVITKGGPLVVSNKPIDRKQLTKMRLGIPGKTTTAYALCSIFLPTPKEAVSFSYNEIIPAVLSGEVDCGLLIHERRDSLEDKRLHLLADLTDSWCAKTKLPLPLGGLVARLDLEKERLNEIVDTLQKSFAYAQTHPEWIVDYCLKHSPIKDKTAVQGAISQWVNADTACLSSKGEQSIRVLLQLMGDKAYRKIVYRA